MYIHYCIYSEDTAIWKTIFSGSNVADYIFPAPINWLSILKPVIDYTYWFKTSHKYTFERSLTDSNFLYPKTLDIAFLTLNTDVGDLCTLAYILK